MKTNTIKDGKTPRKLTPVTWMHFYAPFFLVHTGLYPSLSNRKDTL